MRHPLAGQHQRNRNPLQVVELEGRRHTGEGLEPVEPLAEVVARLGLVGMRRVRSSAKSAAVCSDSASQRVAETSRAGFHVRRARWPEGAISRTNNERYQSLRRLLQSRSGWETNAALRSGSP